MIKHMLNEYLINTIFSLEVDHIDEFLFFDVLERNSYDMYSYDEEKLFDGYFESRRFLMREIKDATLKRNKLYIETKDPNTKENTILIFEDKYSDEVINFLKITGMNWEINRDYNKLADSVEEQIKEEEKESSDPYIRYGVSRKDF